MKSMRWYGGSLRQGSSAFADSSISTATSMAELIAAAEHEGATLPRDAVDRPYPPYPLPGGTQIVGDSARMCVDVPAASNIQVRSGEFVVGGYLPQLVFGRPLKLWGRPLNSSGDMTFLVRAQRVGSAADAIRYETDETIAPLDSDTHEPVAEEAADYRL